MASSTYLLELHQRRERILSDVVDCLGIPAGSTEHELALSVAARSLAHHDQLDAETQKVETAICGFAEKVVLLGRPRDATRLLHLASALSCKPMRLTGHSMATGARGAATDRFSSSMPRLEHPYGALALVLALSGSQRWASAAEDNGLEGQEDRGGDISVEGGWTVPDDQGREGERLGGGLDTSRLWSTDSEEEEEAGGELSLFPGLEAAEQQDGGESDKGTSEWLTAFESDGSDSDGELSPHTDDEGYATGGSQEEVYRGQKDAPPAAPKAAAASSTTRTSGRRPIAANRPIFRHSFGAPCVGADIRSLSGGDCGGSDDSVVMPFLRPCQTLEACQISQSSRKAGTLRRRSIPEAEIVREALHMLQGLAGDIFVRVGPGCRGGGGGGEGLDGRAREIGGDTATATAGHSQFSLSSLAMSGLAVASLSPIALAGVLGDFLRIGNVAEHLRAFTADAESSALVAQARPASGGGCGKGGGSRGERKHGHATQAFAACVRRQLQAFEDAVAERGRWLYRRQRGLSTGDAPENAPAPGITAATTELTVRERPDEPARRKSRRSDGSGGSGETLLGLFSLLRREVESLELTLKLVRAGAGWWVDTPPGVGTHPGRGAGGLRERTGRLFAVLHDELVSDALVRRPPLERGTPALVADAIDAPDALAPLRPGWLLRVFCEVLTPYLRLVDSWITEGRISDPHGELFFSWIDGSGGGGDDGTTNAGGSGGGGGVAGVEGYGGCRAGSGASGVSGVSGIGSGGGGGRGGHARGDDGAAPDPDPVVHVWDAGIVLHSKALPPFLAALAPAVALAGQDISLMRRVRALIVSSSDGGRAYYSATAEGGKMSWSELRRRPSGIGSGMSPDSESLSLATTLIESVRRLAVRVRHASATASRREGGTPRVLPAEHAEDEDEAEENVVSLWVDDRDKDTPEKKTVAVVRANADGGNVATALAAATATVGAGARVGAGATMSRSRAGETSRRASFASVRATMGISRTVETSRRASSFSVRWVEGEAGGHRDSAPRLGEQRGLGLGDVRDDNVNASGIDDNDDDDGDKDGDGGKDGGDGDDNRGGSERVTGGTPPREICDSGDTSVDGDVCRIGSRSVSGGGGGGSDGEGENVMQSEAAAERLTQTERDHGSGDSGGGGGGGGDTCFSGRSRDLGALVVAEEGDSGFFGGTAQLALRPGEMLSRALHPALAPPALQFLGGAAAAAAAAAANMPSSSRRAVFGADPDCRYDVNRGGGVAELGCGSLGADGEERGKRGAGGGGGRGGGDDGASAAAAVAGSAVTTATAMEDVAKVLPPAMILETCLLAPLRKHCRLAGSSCLGVFTEELGIARLVGVLRGIYLSPGGAKGDSPLSRFHGMLFGLLGALPFSSAGGDGSGGSSGNGKIAPAFLDGAVVRDVPAFLQDGSRLTAVLQSSLSMSGLEGGGGGGGGGGSANAGGTAAAGRAEMGREIGELLRSAVVGGNRLLLEHFFVTCHPERVREWRFGDKEDRAGGTRSVAFPFAGDVGGGGRGRCVDLRFFSCLQLECRLPWPLSVALPPRSMEKYSRVLGLLLKLEYTTHVLDESHVLHSYAQRNRQTEVAGAEAGGLDRRHLQQTRLFAFLRVARAVRCYVVTQALVKPWSQFLARVPLCGSLRGFITLHEAYLDLVLERCFLLPQSRQTLAYLIDALQAGVAFSRRYGEYVGQLNDASGRGSSFADSASREEAGSKARESLLRLDGLWEALLSGLGFVIPLLKEMVRSRSGVHVNELLIELDYNGFFELQESWRRKRRVVKFNVGGAQGDDYQHRVETS